MTKKFKNFSEAHPLDENDVKLKLDFLQYEGLQSQVISFIPNKSIDKNVSAIFTHGYTSSKTSVLNWAVKLSEQGISTSVFDLPGHFLGDFHEIQSFDQFTTHTPELFNLALNLQLSYLQEEKYSQLEEREIIYGGHSLGALMALKNHSSKRKIHKILVGFGLNEEHETHFFDTPFFRKTLNIRSQLVSKKISPDKIFSWIKTQKEELKVSSTTDKIALITGEDDVVVGKTGMKTLAKLLKRSCSEEKIKIIKPKKLSHHLPEMASSYILKYIKEELL